MEVSTVPNSLPSSFKILSVSGVTSVIILSSKLVAPDCILSPNSISIGIRSSIPLRTTAGFPLINKFVTGI